MNATSPERSNRIWWLALSFAILALVLAAELTRIHLRLQVEPSHQSFCNVNTSFNCDAVAKSSYSTLLGLPLSVWGVFAYLTAIGAAVWGLRSNARAAAGLLWLVGVASCAFAMVLAAISAFAVKSWCLYCLGTWILDGALLVTATVLIRPAGPRTALRELGDWLRRNVVSSIAVAALALVAVGVTYQAFSHPMDQRSPAAARAAAARRGTVGGKPSEGVDETGQPYVGAQKPKVVITEFSDYQCPHCARAHEQLRAIVEVYPDLVRIVHRHFPLDNDCNPKIRQVFHTRACYYARLAVCAAALGKFWLGNDYLFAHGRDESSVAIESFARAIDAPADSLRACLASEADAGLKRDIEAGIKLDIDGTPTFIIDGEKYTGELPASLLRDYPL